MDIVLLKDHSTSKKDDLLLNLNYSVGSKLLREKIGREATLEDLALGKNAIKKATKTEAKKPINKAKK